jgi:myosin-5
MYSPGEGEERVPASLIRAVIDRPGADKPELHQLMVDVNAMLPVVFPFTPSDPKFPSLRIPKCFTTPFIEKM